MDDTAKRSLDRLRSTDALAALATLMVDQVTATPIREVAPPGWIASQLATVLEAIGQPLARQWAVERIEDRSDALSERTEPLRAHLPEDIDGPLRELLSRPWSPDEDLTFELINQAAIRELLRHILTHALTRFRKRMSSVDENLLGGIGKRAAKRGRGLLGGLGEAVGGHRVGGIAAELAGAVRDEVEGSFDGRVREFARQSAQDQMRSIARYLADPEHAESFATLRLAVLDTLLDTSVAELHGELHKIGPVEVLDVVLAGVRHAVERDSFVDDTTARVQWAMDEVGDGTLGAWLDEVGLAEVWKQTTVELLTARLTAIVATEGFETWWTELHAPD